MHAVQSVDGKNVFTRVAGETITGRDTRACVWGGLCIHDAILWEFMLGWSAMRGGRRDDLGRFPFAFVGRY